MALSQAEDSTEQTPLLFDPHDSTSTNLSQSRGHDIQNVRNEEIAPTVIEEPTTTYIFKSTIGVFLGVIVAAADSSMIATLSAPIASTFGSLSRLPWLLSSFFIATAAIQPLSGKLTDIYGRKNGLIVSHVVFLLGNLICALAKSEWLLILGRFIAGMGGGGITSISSILLSDLIPLRRRGIWQGIGNIFFGTGSGLGGFLGGYINDAYGWRIAFWIQIPISMIAVLLIVFTVNIPIPKDDTTSARTSKIRKVDFPGALTLFAALTLLLLALSSGGNIMPWNHPLVLISLSLSLAFLLTFVVIELKTTEPMIPLRLLWNQSIAAACLTNFFSSMSRFSLLFYLPVYLQIQGYSPHETGLRLVPGSFAVALATLTSGILIRWTGHYYHIGISSQIIYLIGIVMTATFTLRTPSWEPFISFFVANLGYGAMLTSTILAVLVAAEQKHQAVLTSALFLFPSTGTVIGITLAGLTFQNVLRKELWSRISDIDHAEENIRRIIADIGVINEFFGPVREQILEAHMTALSVVFLFLAAMGFLGVITSLLIKDRLLPNNMSRTRRDSNT